MRWKRPAILYNKQESKEQEDDDDTIRSYPRHATDVGCRQNLKVNSRWVVREIRRLGKGQKVDGFEKDRKGDCSHIMIQRIENDKMSDFMSR
jgi:hypothetical protein